MSLAVLLDRRTLYLDVAHPELPDWMRPRFFSLSHEFLVYLRLRSSLLRVWFVYPGHSVYTHAQGLHVLFTTVAVNAFVVALFLGRDQETCSVAAEVSASDGACGGACGGACAGMLSELVPARSARPACASRSSQVIAFFSVMLGSLASSCARMLFRRANLSDPRAKAFYHANKQARIIAELKIHSNCF